MKLLIAAVTFVATLGILFLIETGKSPKKDYAQIIEALKDGSTNAAVSVMPSPIKARASTPIPTSTPAHTPTPTPSPTPQGSSTARQTPVTPTPTQTPIKTPSPTPLPIGPSPSFAPSETPTPTSTPIPLFPTPASSETPVLPEVKKSSSGICHARGTTYYNRTQTYTSYDSIQACLDSGGRLPK